MNAQQSGALSLASIALNLTLLDTLVEKGLLDQEEGGHPGFSRRSPS